jgi:hypothetical protein
MSVLQSSLLCFSAREEDPEAPSIAFAHVRAIRVQKSWALRCAPNPELTRELLGRESRESCALSPWTTSSLSASTHSNPPHACGVEERHEHRLERKDENAKVHHRA